MCFPCKVRHQSERCDWRHSLHFARLWGTVQRERVEHNTQCERKKRRAEKRHEENQDRHCVTTAWFVRSIEAKFLWTVSVKWPEEKETTKLNLLLVRFTQCDMKPTTTDFHCIRSFSLSPTNSWEEREREKSVWVKEDHLICGQSGLQSGVTTVLVAHSFTLQVQL